MDNELEISKAKPRSIKTVSPTGIIESHFVVTDELVKLIKDQVCPGITDTELEYFLYICKKTGLDPAMKQIYAIKRSTYNSESRQYEMKMSIQIGIDGFRLIAQRTGEYLGQTPYYWLGGDEKWIDHWIQVFPPFAAKVGIYRKNFPEATWGYANYKDYVQSKKDGTPTQFWLKFASDMIAKVAETKGLRRAFPQELSGLYGVEEMQQSHFSIETDGQEPENIPAPIALDPNVNTVNTTTTLDVAAGYQTPNAPINVQPIPAIVIPPVLPTLQNIKHNGTDKDICAATWNFYLQNPESARRIFDLSQYPTDIDVLKWISVNGKLFNTPKHMSAIGYSNKNILSQSAPVYVPTEMQPSKITPIQMNDDYSEVESALTMIAQQVSNLDQ